MPKYRLYAITGDGVTGSCVDVECDNEALALLHAEELVSAASGIEVWQGAKLVFRLPALSVIGASGGGAVAQEQVSGCSG
jgi:hypothetical protein